MSQSILGTQASEMASYVKNLQQQICQGLEAQCTGRFIRDLWDREGGGGGTSAVLQNGDTFEKAGVNVSEVYGQILPNTPQGDMFRSMLQSKGVSLGPQEKADFYATGLSLVIHPKNPYVPTTHANYRYFELTPENHAPVWWFGGGADLTPYYLDEADAAQFHQVYKTCCDRHDAAYYDQFKAWCDNYFYLPHREEARGIGGLFFDYLSDKPFEALFDFVKDCGNAFLPSYVPIVEKHKNRAYGDRELAWHQHRRGRYVEFNLIYDRGTLFGLKTNGRTESILMSLPPQVTWGYDVQPDAGSEEAKLLPVLKQPRNWVLNTEVAT